MDLLWITVLPFKGRYKVADMFLEERGEYPLSNKVLC